MEPQNDIHSFVLGTQAPVKIQRLLQHFLRNVGVKDLELCMYIIYLLYSRFGKFDCHNMQSESDIISRSITLIFPLDLASVEIVKITESTVFMCI